jgi:hypothetical protein
MIHRNGYRDLLRNTTSPSQRELDLYESDEGDEAAEEGCGRLLLGGGTGEGRDRRGRGSGRVGRD